jgi:hypothetical protein
MTQACHNLAAAGEIPVNSHHQHAPREGSGLL